MRALSVFRTVATWAVVLLAISGVVPLSRA